jgi:cell division protein FtsB
MTMYKEYFIWVLGVVLVVAVSYGYYQQREIQQRYVGLTESQEKLDSLRGHVESLRTQVQQTELQVKKMETDPLEIEAAIRRDIRKIGFNEMVFEVKDKPENVQVNTEAVKDDVNDGVLEGE